MPVIIDGHNLIGKMSKISLADPNDEEKLVKMLAERMRGDPRKVTVVFDRGADIEEDRHRLSAPGLRVIFAPPQSCADDIIIAMIKKESNPKGLTVVSSDNEIRRCARSRKARLISAEEFARKLEAEPRRPKRESGSEAHIGRIDIDEWRDYFSKRRK